MDLKCNALVTINGKSLDTVVSVKTTNDSAHIGAYCDIVVPLKARFKYQGNKNNQDDYTTAVTINEFKSGDTVEVVANYEGMPKLTIFKGFVYDFIEGTPTTIKCMDWIYKLNQTSLNIFEKSISIKSLLNKVLAGTGVTLLPTIEMNFEDITFARMSPAAILEWLKSTLGLNISLQNDKLYCNIASHTVGTIKLKTDRNVITSGLQRPEAAFQRFKVLVKFADINGTQKEVEVGDKDGTLMNYFYYNVLPRTEANYTKLANNALLKAKQKRYSGNIEMYLYPECDIFWRVEYEDVRYPNRNGVYVVTQRGVVLDKTGFHQNLKLAFLAEK